MSTATEIFNTIASQFSGDSDIASFITLARDRTSTCYYGTNTEMAVALRAAHMKTLSSPIYQTGGAGSIASKREGDLAITYAKSTAGDKDADLSQTSYGLQLIGLREGSGAAFGVTGGRDDGC